MNWFDAFIDPREQSIRGDRVAGVVIGVVTNNQDPDGLGRVKVVFPWLNDDDESAWARVGTLMAGNDRGTYFLPEVDDEVLVAFEHGDLQFPYVIGSLWNGIDTPPEANDDGENNVRSIKSRSGHMIRMKDKNGQEKIEIIDKSGENSLVFDTSNNTITITASKDIVLSATRGTIKLDAQNVEIKSSGNTKIEAGAQMDVKANGQMNINGATVNIN